MAQLARRDLWVISVKIYEYKKQELTFRETKGGIVIKNKKFSLDQGINLVMEDIQEAPSPKFNHAMNSVSEQLTTQKKRPVKWVTLDPDIPNLHKVKQSGLAFKPDVKYPVFEIKPHPSKVGVNIYTMWDDNKREVAVMDEYFVPAQANLQFGALFKDEGGGNVTPNSSPKLSFEGSVNTPMPDIRG